ncbi:Trehalose utilization [Aquisphaera giovannonii]|uniref:Trehalose utilization n=1 Tax=Aquisphaera giovannonii TaxID=406548 RepID=A0A5B9VWZ8_9BACT|nr:ThuA domain-containing protein [Aquisphaera giovannonii]QEH32604.1 Trehalose utilization [Aquisphaera giovannonii]
MRSRGSIILPALLVLLAWPGLAPAQQTRRLLVVGEAKGYQHDAITTAMVTLHDLGKSSGRWETTFRTDCRNITKKPLKYQVKNLDAFDAVAFYTDGDLAMDDSQKADLLSFVRDDGKGFIGIHSATITFPSWPEYAKLIGGSFDGHPWGQFDAPLVVEDAAFPGMKFLSPRFTLRDEIYQIKGFSRERSRVLLGLDASKLDLKVKGVRAGVTDFPVIWAHPYGKGRVLYNGLGHRDEAWEDPGLRRMWTAHVLWAMGLVPGDASPR